MTDWNRIYMDLDTANVLNREWTRVELLQGLGFVDTPIFDCAAADYFSSDAR